jgi:hypothetical protein
MVFRGFLANSLNLLSVTDVRSEKVKDWQVDGLNKFEISWYFTESREQYRIAGNVLLLSKELLNSLGSSGIFENSVSLNESLLTQQWNRLSKASKEMYSFASPKTPLVGSIQASETSSESQSNRSEKSNSADDTFDISENFCLVIFVPSSVDYLNLKCSPQFRCLSEKSSNWSDIVVNA